MEREQFKILVKAMKATYPQDTFIPDQDSFNVWYSLLQDIPYDRCHLAVQKYILTRKFPPTIADIREMASDIVKHEEEQMSELAAWSLVYKAICNSGYNSVDEFNKLPELCRIAVGNPSNLKEWALMNTDQVTSIAQSHFARNYRVAIDRMKENSKLPEGMKLLIADAGKKYRQEIEEKKKQELPQKEEVAKEREYTPMSESVRKKLEELHSKL